MYMVRDHSSPGMEGQGQRSKLKVRGQNVVGGTLSEDNSGTDYYLLAVYVGIHCDRSVCVAAHM